MKESKLNHAYNHSNTYLTSQLHICQTVASIYRINAMGGVFVPEA